MSSALLIVPHFWDPVCVPLGISSLKAIAETRGHRVHLLDLNADPTIFNVQRLYFEEVKRQFPRWRMWNIERNGTEMLAMHQVLYLKASHSPRYRDLVIEVLNVTNGPPGEWADSLDIRRFDALFERLYANVSRAVLKRLHAAAYDFVGCSLFNSTWPGTLFTLKLAKTLRPNVRTVAGGPGPLMGLTANPAEIESFFSANDFIDYFVVGEGEKPFLRILDGQAPPRGVITAASDGGASAPLNLSEIPDPDYGELDVGRYLQLSVATSRGCPFECSFCAETKFWQSYRSVQKSKTFERLERLATKYNRRSFYLCDSLSNGTIQSLTEDIQKSGTPYLIDCYLRPDKSCTDPAKTSRWRSGGLHRARLGMESASQRILDGMNKKTTPATMSDSLRALADGGTMTSTLWIVGYPGETEREFQQTLDFIRAHRKQIYQADAWLFQYHRAGLSGSAGLDEEYGSHTRFSEDLNAVLSVTPYMIDRYISAEERFERLERFVATTADLNIPNPYSVFEWAAAEQRWRDLGRHVGTAAEDSIMALNA